MERELWPPLYHAIRSVARDFHQKYVQLQPWILVAVQCWAALHDRPLSWACRRRHWSTTTLRPHRLPSPSTLSRRLDGVVVGAFLRALEQRCRDVLPARVLSLLDGKPLPVGGCSKDKEAKYGRGQAVRPKAISCIPFGRTAGPCRRPGR